MPPYKIVGGDEYYSHSKNEENTIAHVLNARPRDNSTHLAILSFKVDFLVGAILSVLHESGVKFVERDILKVIFPAVVREHVQCLLDSWGKARSAIVWGWLADDTISMNARQPITQLSPLAFNEGERLTLLMSAGEEEYAHYLLNSWISGVGQREDVVFIYPGVFGNADFEAYSKDNFLSLLCDAKTVEGKDE